MRTCHDLTAVGATTETAWRGQARCREGDAEHFFAPAHVECKPDKDAREEQARALCRSCAVQRVCLEWSLVVQEPHGIWGGLNELERRRALRLRTTAPEPSLARSRRVPS